MQGGLQGYSSMKKSRCQKSKNATKRRTRRAFPVSRDGTTGAQASVRGVILFRELTGKRTRAILGAASAKAVVAHEAMRTYPQSAP
jgi:hypothetical protein